VNNDYKLKLNFLFLVLSFGTLKLFSQVSDEPWVKLQNDRIDTLMSILTKADPQFFWVKFHSIPNDTIIQRVCTQGTLPFDYCLLADGNSLNIQYLNDTLWYLYGTVVGYWSYPFIFKTTNAGKSWQKILDIMPIPWNCIPLWAKDFVVYRTLDKNLFHMFNSSEGIWIVTLKNHRIIYRLTNDGGLTWKNKSAKLKNISAENDGYYLINKIYTDSFCIKISIKHYVLMNESVWVTSPTDFTVEYNHPLHKFLK
jgi:hypothetical protein